MDKLFLKDILEHMDEKDRKLIVLRYYRDKTQSETASQLNISQVQVSRMEKRILMQMREQLK